MVQKAVPHLVAVQKAVPQLEELHFHHYQLEELHLEVARYNQEVVLHYQEVLHLEEVHSHHPLEAVLVHCSKVDILVQLDYLHNLLDLVLDHLEVEYHPLLEAGYNHPLQEEALVLLVPRFEDILERKDYHHNLDPVLFHLVLEEVEH